MQRKPIPRTHFSACLSRTLFIESGIPTATFPEGDLAMEPTIISNNSNTNHIPAGAPHVFASDSHATEITSP